MRFYTETIVSIPDKSRKGSQKMLYQVWNIVVYIEKDCIITDWIWIKVCSGHYFVVCIDAYFSICFFVERITFVAYIDTDYEVKIMADDAK